MTQEFSVHAAKGMDYFRNVIRGAGTEAPAPAVDVAANQGFTVAAEGVPAGNIATATEFVAQPVVADPATIAGAVQAVPGQQQEFVVQPRIVMEQAPQTVLPMDVHIAPNDVRMAVAPAQVIVVDQSGNVVGTTTAAAAGNDSARAATSSRQGFRSWDLADLTDRFRRPGAATLAAPATTPPASAAVAATTPAATPAAPGWRDTVSVESLAGRFRHAPDAPIVAVAIDAPTAATAAGTSWRPTIDTSGIGKLFQHGAEGASKAKPITPVIVDEGASGARSVIASASKLFKRV